MDKLLQSGDTDVLCGSSAWLGPVAYDGRPYFAVALYSKKGLYALALGDLLVHNALLIIPGGKKKKNNPIRILIRLSIDEWYRRSQEHSLKEEQPKYNRKFHHLIQ